MSDHIEVVKRAIEFRSPDYLPMEIIDVPHVYNAYHTLDPDTVEFIPGTENFDSLWPCCLRRHVPVPGSKPANLFTLARGGSCSLTGISSIGWRAMSSCG